MLVSTTQLLGPWQYPNAGYYKLEPKCYRHQLEQHNVGKYNYEGQLYKPILFFVLVKAALHMTYFLLVSMLVSTSVH